MTDEEIARGTRLPTLYMHLVAHGRCRGYAIVQVDDTRPTITCLVCGRTSSNQSDVAQKYCGACHLFHEDPRA